MKKALPIGVAVIVVVVLLVYLVRRGDEPAAGVEPANVEQLKAEQQKAQQAIAQQQKAEELKAQQAIDQQAKEAVSRILEPRGTAPGLAELSVLEFEVPEEVEESVTDTPGSKAVAARVSPGQVLAVVNGKPLTAEKLVPPSRFKRDGAMVLPSGRLEELLAASIDRELAFQEAEAEGVDLVGRDLEKLEGIYRSIANPQFNMKGDWSGKKLVTPQGNAGDAAFHVEKRAALFLQREFLRRAGEADTLETRQAFREQLRSGANIEKVDLEPPEGEAAEQVAAEEEAAEEEVPETESPAPPAGE